MKLIEIDVYLINYSVSCLGIHGSRIKQFHSISISPVYGSLAH